MKISVIGCGSDKVGHISQIVTQLGIENEIILLKDLYDSEGVCSYSFDHYDGIIMSGSPITLDCENKKDYLKHFPFIKQAQIPLLGICFGHQVIAHIFGADFHNSEYLKGDVTINILKHDSLFKNITDSTFRADHGQHVEVPKDFVLIADSDECRNEAMQHISKPIYGVQFHPELSGENGKKLISNFLEICRNSPQ